MTADARLTELEIALTHQAEMLEELSGVLRLHADRIDRIERRVGAILDRIAAARVEPDPGEVPDPDARPPHW